MISTFHGLETARRSLMAHQAALHTTGHNIANANTPGYSRQRVNLTPGEPFPNTSFQQPGIPGQIGSGVKVDSIQRYREQFLDLQYRNENAKHGFWAARFDSLQKMEDIMNEPSEDGIANTMDRFWNALQDLSVHPEDSGARSVVRQQGYALADTFNYISDSLKTVQRDLQQQIDGTTHEMNSLIRQINNLNLQISKVEPHGYVPNDLYDERDLLVDQLSKIVNIKVETVSSGGNPTSVAEGLYTIKLADENGREFGVTLVNGQTFETNEVKIGYEQGTSAEKGLIEKIYFGSPNTLNSRANLETTGGVTAFSVNDFKAHGKLAAEMEAYGYYDAQGNELGVYPDMLYQLDLMVHTFVEELNAIHRQGWSLNDVANGTKVEALDFFTYKGDPSTWPTSDNVKGAASNIQISRKIQDELDNIAASGASNVKSLVAADGTYTGPLPTAAGLYTGEDPKEIDVRYDATENKWFYTLDGAEQEVGNGHIFTDGIVINVPRNQPSEDMNWSIGLETFNQRSFSGDGSNAQALANVKDQILNYGGSTTNVQSFYQAIIGDMAVNTSEANRMMRNADTLRTTVDERRMSASSVSLDEEMANIIKFQHAYNAAARNVTMIDDMLDRIINRMGRSGL
ncbi:flagellar hook-associated protein FlgK [Alkalihalophilus pseudofirmus]|nr:flagellar hook-associated protein FlgK [Alkalihalophilus pseudofirmus]